MPKKQADKAHDEAIDQINKTYDEAKTQASQAFRIAIDIAKKNYLEARAEADRVYAKVKGAE